MLAIVLAAALVQAPMELRLAPRVKDAWTVEFRERFANTAEEFDETDVWREEYRVLAVDASGARVSFKRTFLYTDLDGNKIPPAKGNGPIEGETTLRTVGGAQPYSDVSQPISAARVARLDAQGVWYPEGKARIGQRWGLEYQREGQIPGAKASWWLARVEEIHERRCAVVGFQFVEDPAFDYPMNAQGERWVDIATGLVLEERVTTSNFPVPGGAFRVQRTATRKLVECRLAPPP